MTGPLPALPAARSAACRARPPARPPTRTRAAALALAPALAFVPAVLVLFPLAPAPSFAEELPIRRFDVRDGLAHTRVNAIYQDARDYLWFARWEGLSRFDGERFTSYGTRDGLPIGLLNAIAEDPHGHLWVATHGAGVARLVDDPRGDAAVRGDAATGAGAEGGEARAGAGGTPRRAFVAHRVGASRRSNVVYGIAFDPAGEIWCVTEDGLFHGRLDETETPRFERALADLEAPLYGDIFRDGGGWPAFLTESELIRAIDGRVVRVPRPRGDEGEAEGGAAGAPTGTGRSSSGPGEAPSAPGDAALAQTHPPSEPATSPRWLVVDPTALFEVVPPGGDRDVGRWVRVPVPLAPEGGPLCATRDVEGALWVGTRRGLVRRAMGRIATFTTTHGLSDDWIRCLAADRDGNLWIGTHLGGVCCLMPTGIMSFTPRTGLPDGNVLRVVEGRGGRIYASTDRGGIAEIVGGEVRPLPGSTAPPFSSVHMRIMRDRRGDWWLGTNMGLYRCEGPELDVRRARRVGAAEGLPQVAVFGAIHEDAGGRIWFGGVDGATYCYDPSRSGPAAVTRFPPGAGPDPPREFLTDRDGVLWLAPYVGLWRFRDGRFEAVEPGEGFPDPDVDTRFLYQDRRGRLWIGLRFHGVAMTEEPSAERPRFATYSTANGLASDAVWAISEDAAGRIYLATARGLDQLDPESGRVRHITTAEGLAGDVVNFCMTDSRGHVWAATSGGVSRFDPGGARAPVAPPPVYIARIEVAGEEVPVGENGARLVRLDGVPSSRSNLLIECVGLSFVGGPLAYQWRLEGVDADWSRPLLDRHVNYAHLPPGAYRFLARAVNAEGMASPEPAVVEFRVLAPVWRRPWFVALAVAAVLAAALLAHRARVARILAMERVRRQIATDLHDEIGSGLSQVAVLSEVAKREGGGEDSDRERLLDEVARLARTMRDEMSDIVWAVDPRRDHLTDLVHRMRQVTFNLLEADGLHVGFHAPEDAAIAGIGMPPDRRRQLFLIFKETLTNVARHARASRVRIDLEVGAGSLSLTIQDNGRGFDPARTNGGGHGVESLRLRAADLGARLALESGPGRGTRVAVEVPLRER